MSESFTTVRKALQTELTVLRLIHATPCVSRVELAEISGLSTAAITGIVNSLLTRQLLIEDRALKIGSGRKRVGLALRHELASAAGVEIGTTNLRLCITDMNGNVVIEREVKSEMLRGREDVLARTFSHLQEMLRDSGTGPSGLRGIGVAFSGAIDAERGTVLSYPRPGQLEQWRNIPLRDRFEQEFGVPALVENSVRTVAVMEKLDGAGRDLTNFVYIDAGMGIGATIFIDGRMYRGHRGSAGEFGHITVDAAGPLCCCGSRGCLEALASGASIIESVKDAIRRGVSTKIIEADGFQPDAITVEMIADAAKENDSLSYRVLSDAATHIGAASADLINLLNPSALIFGGAVIRAAPHLLIEGIRSAIRRRAMERSANDVVVQASQLDTSAGARGAARLMTTQLVDGIFSEATAQFTEMNCQQ